MMPSGPTATPRGSPGSSQRWTICGSLLATGVSFAAFSDAAEKVSSPMRVRLLVNRVGEVFDDRIGKESFTHLLHVPFDRFSGLLTFRQRDSKQLAGADIFHPFESERAQGVLDRLPLRIEDGGLQLDGDGGLHLR